MRGDRAADPPALPRRRGARRRPRAARRRRRARRRTSATSSPSSCSTRPPRAPTSRGPPHLDEDYLVLSTIHSAKGLEWDAVHVIARLRRQLPRRHERRASEESIAEERRLLYVALTRARRRLHVYVPAALLPPPAGQRRRARLRQGVALSQPGGAEPVRTHAPADRRACQHRRGRLDPRSAHRGVGRRPVRLRRARGRSGGLRSRGGLPARARDP